LTANFLFVIYIAIRYTSCVPSEITPEEYRALAELRYRIRHFLREGDAKARAVGLEPQQYLMLLAIRGLPEGAEATIQTLAERLALKHHSAVELVDRLETHGYVRRSRSRDDRRRVFVSLLPKGDRLLEQVARHRISELRTSGEALVSAIEALLQRKAASSSGIERSPKSAAKASKKRTRSKELVPAQEDAHGYR
jgi:DNA-binding MarR family transcriptional regulator